MCDEVVELIDSLELVRVCCGAGADAVAIEISDGLLGRLNPGANGLFARAGAAPGCPRARILSLISARARLSRSSGVNLVARAAGCAVAAVFAMGD